jgi:hypothetical protein
MKWLRWFKRKPREAVKPTTILANMLVSEMLMNVTDVKVSRMNVTDVKVSRSYSKTHYEFPHVKVDATTMYDKSIVGASFILVGLHTPDWGEEATGVLMRGFGKFLELRRKAMEIKKEHDRQTKAVDAIAFLLGVKEKT